MVAGTLWISVVARMKRTCSGGSSSVFSRALKAPGESMCTSSMIYTRLLRVVGAKPASSRMSRMLSTPLLEAASISLTSRADSSRMDRQAAHRLQGEPFWGFSQHTARARILAQVVLPVPRVPVKR